MAECSRCAPRRSPADFAARCRRSHRTRGSRSDDGPAATRSRRASRCASSWSICATFTRAAPGSAGRRGSQSRSVRPSRILAILGRASFARLRRCASAASVVTRRAIRSTRRCKGLAMPPGRVRALHASRLCPWAASPAAKLGDRRRRNPPTTVGVNAFPGFGAHREHRCLGLDGSGLAEDAGRHVDERPDCASAVSSPSVNRAVPRRTTYSSSGPSFSRCGSITWSPSRAPTQTLRPNGWKPSRRRSGRRICVPAVVVNRSRSSIERIS